MLLIFSQFIGHVNNKEENNSQIGEIGLLFILINGTTLPNLINACMQIRDQE